jgi:hypothetical protein
MPQEIQPAKVLLGFARIISGVLMVREGMNGWFSVMSFSPGDIFMEKRPDRFHVNDRIFNLIPGRISVTPHDDRRYPYEAMKTFMGAQFIMLLEATEVWTETRLMRKAA